jgi:hypothetical protein
MLPMKEIDSLSKTGVQLTQPSVVFHTPSETTPK